MVDQRQAVTELENGGGVSPESVHAQLRRILASSDFAGAPRLSRLLRYLVEHAAAGDRDIQEYAIGVEVFDRGPSFDPRTDAIVRVQARRLRSRLDAYYQGAGSTDPVLIEVPKGHYRAVFRQRPTLDDSRPRRRLPLTPVRAGVLAVALAAAVALILLWPVWRPSTVDVPHQAIAVLPFHSLSDEPQHEFFSDGISAEILNELARYPDLIVVARDSSFALKRQGADAVGLSRLLGVNYLLQGSVRHEGQQLRVTARLVDRAGVQRWSDAYDRNLGDVFAIQQEIAAAVVASVAPQVNPPPGRDRPPKLDAYRHYLIGREILANRLPTFVQDGITQLRRAVAIDPGYADAQAELAVALTLSFWWRTGSCCPAEADEPDPLDEARQAVATALRLDPDLARAHAAEGLWLQMQPEPDWPASEQALRRAKALDLHQVDTLNWLSGALFAQRRMAEAVAELESAARIDPLAVSVNTNLARVHAQGGRLDEAERRLLNLLEVPIAQPLVHLDLAGLYLGTGRLAEALQSSKRAILTYVEARGEAGLLEVLGRHYATLGMWDPAHAWLDRADAISGNAVRMTTRRALVMQLEGRHAEMLERFSAVLALHGLAPSQLTEDDAVEYGLLMALSGAPLEAVDILEPHADLMVVRGGHDGPYASHALAWAHARAGDQDKAVRILEQLEEHFHNLQRHGLLHLGEDLLMFAQNAALMGDAERAAERLEAAADAGWRNYYAVAHDPRWAELREHPRIAAVLARVKADLDRQRDRVETLDRHDDFAGRLDNLVAHARDD